MSRPLRSIHARARIARGWSAGFYVVGVAALGSGLLVGGIVAAATGTAAGLVVATVIAVTGLATGALGLWESRRFRNRAQDLEATVSEHRLYGLARAKGGVLCAADVARGLGVRRSEAEELLDHLVDEVRVSMRVTDDGQIEYVFWEAERSARPPVRVATSEGAPASESRDVRIDSDEIAK